LKSAAFRAFVDAHAWLAIATSRNRRLFLRCFLKCLYKPLCSLRSPHAAEVEFKPSNHSDCTRQTSHAFPRRRDEPREMRTAFRSLILAAAASCSFAGELLLAADNFPLACGELSRVSEPDCRAALATGFRLQRSMPCMMQQLASLEL
jgi:hypothetical protein